MAPNKKDIIIICLNSSQINKSIKNIYQIGSTFPNSQAKITKIKAVILSILITGVFCNLILPLPLTMENYSYSLESTSIFSSSSLLSFSPGIFLIYFCWRPWMGLCILGSDGIKVGGHRYIISIFPALLSASISVHVHNDTWLCNNSTTHSDHLLSRNSMLVIVLSTLLVFAWQETEYWK